MWRPSSSRLPGVQHFEERAEMLEARMQRRAARKEHRPSTQRLVETFGCRNYPRLLGSSAKPIALE